MSFKKILLDLIEEYVPGRHRLMYSIIRKDPRLLSWINDQIPESTHLPEQIYCIINSLSPVCEHGKKKKFVDSWNGHAMCGRSQCRCWVENQSLKLKKVKQSMTDEQWRAVLDKRKATNLSKYGTEFAAQNEDVKRKIAERNIEKYGVKTTLLLPEMQDQIRKTLEIRYGVSNPMQSKEIKTKAMETCVERYGHVVYPHSLEGREIVKNTMKSRYNVTSISQLKFSQPVRDLLQDTERFHMEYKKLGINGLCEQYPELNYGMCRSKLIREGVEDVIKFSKPESFVKDILDQLGVRYSYHNRKIISPQELDFYLPDQSIAIEVCGLYWHRHSLLNDRFYHLKKLESCLAKGINLLTIFSDHIDHKPSIVETRLLAKLNLIPRSAHARNLIITDSLSRTELAAFLDANHIQGSRLGSVNLGAVDGSGKIHAVMTFGNLRRSLGRDKTPDSYEMYRFAVEGNVPGVASRLFKRFLEIANPATVLSYSDRCWGEGRLYQQLGFSLESSTQPNYWYTKDFLSRTHRFGFTKHSLVQKGYDPNLTEREIMQSLGYDKVFDCGSNRYVWTNHNWQPRPAATDPKHDLIIF